MSYNGRRNNNMSGPANMGKAQQGIYAPDYVDIHGRNLNAMIAEDGTIYIPLQEVKKTGFHIFPITHFNNLHIGRTLVLSEFQLFMLGAAKEFMLKNSIHSLTQNDIIETIEMCRKTLIEEGVKEEDNSSKGTLGRTLLADPMVVHKEVRNVLNQSLQSKPGLSGLSSQMSQSPKESFGNLHKDSQLRGSNSSLDSNKHRYQNGDTSNRNSFDRPNTFQNQNRNTSFQHQNNDHHKNIGSRLKVNNRFNKKGSDGEENPPNYERIKLQRTPQEVKVAHVDTSNDKQKYWVQLVENEDCLMEIIEECNNVADGAPVMTPKIGELYMAMSQGDGYWYRCVVQSTSPYIKVNFIDFGNDEIVKQVRQLPHELRKKPAQAVRVTLNQDVSMEIKVDDVLTMRNMKEYSDLTVLVAVEQKKTKTVQKEIQPILMEQIKYSTAIKNGEAVKIIAFDNGKLYLRSKEMHQSLMQIAAEIKETPQQPLKHVVRNQMVLCKKEEESILCRAVVRDINGTEINVQYVDFFTSATVPLRTLFVISKTIANFPPALIESPVLKGYMAVKFNQSVKNRITQEIENKTKFSVDVGMEFDLLFSNDSHSLSEELFPLDLALRPPKKEPEVLVPQTKSPVQKLPEPKPPVQKSPVQKPPMQKTPIKKPPYVKIKYDEMTPCEVPLGTGDYLMMTIRDMMDFTMASTSAENAELIAQCSSIQIDDDELYEPEDETEMVLACYEGDWFRGVFLDKKDDGNYSIWFIDFGNCAEVTTNEIRKFPEELRKIPLLGIACKLDVPETEEIKQKFSEYVKQDMEYTVNIISHTAEDLVYTVDIPKFTDILRKQNLL